MAFSSKFLLKLAFVDGNEVTADVSVVDSSFTLCVWPQTFNNEMKIFCNTVQTLGWLSKHARGQRLYYINHSVNKC